MSKRSSICFRYYCICNNIDLSTYDNELVEVMAFRKYGMSRLNNYFEDKKIIIDKNFYKKLLDLYVYINFDSCCDYHEYCLESTCCCCFAKFIMIIASTGYEFNLEDIVYFPFVGLVINKLLKKSFVLYDNNDNNENTTEKIKNMIKNGCTDLKYCAPFLLNYNDDEIKLYARLLTLESINKKTLISTYNNINLKPNKSHMNILLNNFSHPNVKAIKSIMDFFDKHNVCLYEREIKLLNVKYKKGCFSKKYNATDELINYSKKKKSYSC